ncbi:ABSCISIC ACID-INSENSITIVE 5-like protein 5 [Phragmites australis]|uniref:ABSCISIC ACID-INSENSITIVE 5-like protein 5 n=1 Tax=Phragmites australis TaxID=29695 RepID=UPI002D76AD55|nr:ABSCISIC ACID-INSENSITIVE 5-like protein 5 [Phragmites australis]
MGVQTMSSHGNGGGGGALSWQGSVCSLTLTEVESQLGEPLRSMNLDDLLRTVLPAAPAAEPSAAAMASKKTVDEVWRDIQSSSSGRQPTMGEMTLEDFLSRAGVAFDGGAGCAGLHWLHQYQPQLQYVGARPHAVGAAPVLDAVYRDGVGGFLSQMAGRKRGAPAAAAAGAEDGVVERTVERRQKRMIKNRESAARSRARKQAYTNELENKIARLEEENERLRKLQMLEPLEPPPEHERRPVPQPEPKKQLRRTNSASF